MQLPMIPLNVHITKLPVSDPFAGVFIRMNGFMTWGYFFSDGEIADHVELVRFRHKLAEIDELTDPLTVLR